MRERHPRHHKPVALLVALLGAWLLSLAWATPVAAQAEVTPNTPCYSSRNLTNLTGGGIRGITNQPVISGNGNRVAFWSVNDLGGGNVDGNIEIFVRETANSNVVQLTDSVGSILGGFNLEPSINTAGTHIAFYSDRDLIEGQNQDGNFEIFLARRANNATWSIRQITNTDGSANLFPSINAAGTRIAFVSDDSELHNVDQSRVNADRNFEIFLATIPTSGDVQFRQITNTGAGVTNDQPVINATGDRLAFTASTGQTAQVFVWDAAQNSPAQLTQTDTNDQPSISADGTSIIYIATTADDRSRVVLHTLSADGSESRAEVIVPSASNTKYRGPSISGNGGRVVYVAEQGTGAAIQIDVMLYDVNTGLGVPISEVGGGTGEQPAISSDGTRVTFVGVQAVGGSTDNTGADIYLNECPQSDLVLSFEEPPATTVLAGVDVEYTFRVTNNGPSAAEDVFFHSNFGALKGLPVNVIRKLPPGCTEDTTDFYCPLGDLAVNASRVFTFGYEIPSNAELSDIVSAIDVGANAVDSNPDNNATGQFTTRIFEESALALQVTATPATILAGSPDQLTYELRVTNNGPSQARSARITDTLPIGASFVNVQITQGGGAGASCGTPVGRVLACALGNLTAGSVTVVRIRVTADANAPATFTNVATVRALTDESNLANNTVTTQTPIERSADLAITKFATANSVIAGTEITYTLAYTNRGFADTVAVQVIDTLPPNVAYVRSVLPGGATCAATSDGRTVTCNFPGNLLVNQSRTFSIVALVHSSAPAGTITNSATVSSGRSDPNPTNNVTPEVQTQVTLLGDLVVSKTVNEATPDVGEVFTYTVRVRNNGPSQAYDVVVNDLLPSELTFEGATASVGTYDANSGVWAIGTLPVRPAGQESTLRIRVRALDSAGGDTKTNTATAAGSQPEPVPGLSNTASVNVVPQLADVQLQKRSTPAANVVAGQRLTYTLTITNAGPTTARSVVLVDDLPDDVFLVSATAPACSGNANTVTCNAGNMINGAVVNYTIVVTRALKGPITNLATVSSLTPDIVPINNNASHSITVIPDVPANLVYTVQPPSSIEAGVTFTPPVRLELRDRFNNLVNETTGSDDTVRLLPFTNASCTNAAASGAISGNEVNAVSGEAVFAALSYTRSQTIYLQATDVTRPSVTPACSTAITVDPGDTSKLVFVTASQTVTAGRISDVITVQRRDEFENPTLVESMTVTLTTDSTRGGFIDVTTPVTITTVAIPSGQSSASFRYRDIDADTYTLTASGPPGIAPATQEIIVVAGPASSLLVVVSAPPTVTAGIRSTDIVIARVDDFGNENESDPTLPVALDSDSPDPDSFEFYDNEQNLTDETEIVVGTSRATLSYLDTLAGERELTFDALIGDIEGASITLTVVPSVTHHLVFSTPPRTVTAGVASETIQVAREDFYNNRTFGGPNTVVQLTSTSTGTMTYTPSSTITILDGSDFASFTYADTLAGVHELTAASGGLVGANQDITVTAAAAARLRFITPARTIVAGQPSELITVERQDSFGNARIDPEIIVTLATTSAGDFAFLNQAGNAQLNGGNQLIIADNAAQASFTYSDTLVGNPQISVSGSGLEGHSQIHTVGAGALGILQWSVITTQTNDIPFTQGTITARDAFSNVITNYNAVGVGEDVALTVTNRPTATVVLLGSGDDVILEPADFVNGVANLVTEQLRYQGLAGNVTFRATSGSVSGERTVAIVPGALTSLTLTGESSATAGVAFDVTLTGRDVSHNLIANGLYSVVFNGADPAPNSTVPTANGNNFGAAFGVQFTNGVATVSLILPNADSTIIDATIGSVTSNELSVNVTAAETLAELLWSNIPMQTSAVPFTEGTITARDAFSNVITNFDDLGNSVTITVTNRPTATVTLAGSAPAVLAPEDFANGVADLATEELTYTGLSGNVNFSATSGAISNGRTIEFGAGAIATLVLTGPVSATAGVAFDVTLTARDASGNLVGNVAYDVEFTGADESLDGDDPTANGEAFDELFELDFVNGVATVSLNLPLAELTTLVATVDATPDVVSNELDVDVLPGTATRLALAMAVSPNLTAGVTRTLTITAFDGGGNVATGYVGTKSLTFSGPQASTRPVTPATVGNNVGTAINIGTPTPLEFSQGVVVQTGAAADFRPTRAGTNVTLSASDGSISSNTLTFAVVAAGANKISISPATASIVAGNTVNLSMSYEDAFGNLRTDVGGNDKALRFFSDVATAAPDGTVATVTRDPSPGGPINISAANNSVQIDFPGGISTVSGGNNGVLRISKAGTYVLTVDDLGTGGGLNEAQIAGALTITVTPALLEELAWSVTGPQTNTVAFNNGTLTALDEFENVVTTIPANEFPIQATAPTFGLVFFDNSGVNNGLDAADFENGVADLSLDSGAGMRYVGDSGPVTIIATSQQSVIGNLNITINPGPIAEVTLTGPSSATAGTPINVTVVAEDVSGNPVADGTRSVTFNGASNAPDGTVPRVGVGGNLFGSPFSLSFTGGSATVPVTLTNATPTDLTATLDAVPSDPLAVNVAASTALAALVWDIDGPQASGAPMVGSLTAQDSFSNTITGFAATVAIAETSVATGTLSLTEFVAGDWASGEVNLATADGGSGLSYETQLPMLPETITLQATLGPVNSSVDVDIVDTLGAGSVSEQGPARQFFLPSIMQPGGVDSQSVEPQVGNRMFLPTLRLPE